MDGLSLIPRRRLETGGTNTQNFETAILNAAYEVPHETIELTDGRMTCATCAGRVEKALGVVTGVIRASVNLAGQKAYVETLRGCLSNSTNWRKLFRL